MKFFLFVLIISPFIFNSCSSKSNTQAKNAPAPFCIPDSLINQIKIDTVTLKPVYEELRLIGKISFDQDKVVRLYPLVSGNVVEVRVSLGSYVKKGEIMAVIRSSEMAGAENDLVTAQSNLAISEKNY